MTTNQERRRLSALIEEANNETRGGMAIAAFIAIVLAAAIAFMVLHFGSAS